MSRFAVLVAAAVAASALAASAQEEPQLRPDQEEVLELMTRGMDPGMKMSLREQLLATVLPLTEEQTALMLPAMRESAGPAEEEVPDEDAPPALSEADFEYNKAQYEPALRLSWQAQHDFDVHVRERIEAACPARDEYKVVAGAAYYELLPLSPTWPTASDDADIDVAVIGGSYAPQDGRYNFDFSEIRTTYDQAAVDQAIDAACAAWEAEGQVFKAHVQGLVDAEKWDEAHNYEMGAYGKIDAIVTPLQEVLQREAPSADYAVFNALMNGTKVE
jgi:hypothetical protein